MPVKDQCKICQRVLPYYRLRRCQRCSQLYCRDCMVSEVATGDPTRLFCLNCARKTVSPRSFFKYNGLTGYLKFRGSFTNVVRLSLARMDGIIGDNLPMEAYKNAGWWSNSPGYAHTQAWLDAGWHVEEVNVKEGYVVFRKVKELQSSTRRKPLSTKITKPFTPVHVRIPKPKTPSKTKVSKLYARIKNLERQRTSVPTYHGSFKPRPRHEKSLFKPDEKPN